VCGQQQPRVEVPVPDSLKARELLKHRFMSFIIRHFRKNENKVPLTVDQLAAMFRNQNVNSASSEVCQTGTESNTLLRGLSLKADLAVAGV